MKTVFVSHHADFVGGGELSLLQLVQALHDRGVELSLVVPREGWCSRQARASGVATAFLPMPGIGSWASLKALAAWHRYFRQQRCDVLHANTSRAAFYAGLTGRRLGIPVVFHCRIAEKDRRLDWLLARLATRIVANSQATAQRFLPRFADKVETIYNGIPLSNADGTKGRPAEIGGGRMVLCVARVSRWKRHDLVLEAFALLAETEPDVQLVMLGGSDPSDPNWMEELKRRSAAMPCGERIHWLGQRDDMAAWYGAADALILASRREPFGRVVVEAMASGVPVVAANAGGPAEIIEQGVSGVLVDADMPAAWADALRRVLTHDSFRERLIDQGGRRAADFSLDRHVEAMQGLFAGLLEEGR
jgi:glycosyltransferase involved in cell wall biosynthesis